MYEVYLADYALRDLRVHVYLIADGRRDMQTLLSRRLLGA